MSLAAKLMRPRPSNFTPVPYVGRNGGLAGLSVASSRRSDQVEQMAAMGSIPTLFAVVHKLSTGVAAAEWNLFKEPLNGAGLQSAEQVSPPVTRHAALDLLRKPNPWMPWQEFCEVTQQHIDLTGEGWWVVVRHPMVKSIPLEMWPVRPDRMAPVPDAKEFLIGYVYTTPDGNKVPLEVDEVIQIRMPNPLDMYRGLGPVQALMTNLDSAQYTAQWNRNFFKNSAEPGGIIQVDRSLSENEFNDLRERWNEQHKGVSNAHRVAILELGQWVDRKFTMRDMQFAELQRLSRDQILEGFGFPKVMLGATDGVNLANALAGEYMFSKWLISTRLDRIKGAIDNDLLPMFGPTATGMKWIYESPVPEDQAAENAKLKTKVDAFVALLRAGVEPLSASETVGLPPMAVRSAPSPAPIGAPGSTANGHRHREMVPA